MSPGRRPRPHLAGAGSDLLKVLRELVAIPAAAALRLAELIGRGVLVVLRVAWPLLHLARRGFGAFVRIAARELTPVRALMIVNLVVLAALAATQTVDYRDVSVGVGDYSIAGVDSVAPAPQVLTESSVAAHGAAIWIAAAAGLALLALAVIRRPSAAWGIALVGAAAIVVGLAIDRPAGLDPGDRATAYEGVEAALLDGFWAQLAAGLALLVTGPLLAFALRARRAEPVAARAERRGLRLPRPRRAETGADRAGGRTEGERGRRSRSRPRPADGPS